MPKLYKVIRNSEVVRTRKPGKYAGSKRDKIFGRLDCTSGMRLLQRQNRVFFANWDDAIEAGFRPCLVCKPHIIRTGEKIDVFHPALDRSHIALWGTNPRPYPEKPQVCFYVALNWDSAGPDQGEEVLNQVTLENWFPKPTAIKKAIAWGKKLGLPVIDCCGPVENLVLYVPDNPVSREQFQERKRVLASKKIVSLTHQLFFNRRR